jgi:hypothetical protein
MRICRHFPEVYLINRKGQSLIELASFGTILILCLAFLIEYGMRANYEQNMQMQVFRRAMRAAFYKTGPASSVSLTMTKDKASPDPRDQWGFVERKPVSASAVVTWDSNVNSDYVENYDDAPQQSDLPRSITEINDTLGLKDAHFNDSFIDHISSADGAFKTADYGQGGCQGGITMVLEYPEKERQALHQEYREVPINCADIRVLNRQSKKDDPGRQNAYVMIDGLKQVVSSADIDNDKKLETIIAVKGMQACDDDGYCGKLQSWKYIDYQVGEIDTDYAAVYPWETNKKGASITAQQGMLADYTLSKSNNNTLTKTETPSSLTTTTSYSGTQQAIIHRVRLNNGSVQQYTTTFRPAEGIANWGAVSK